MKCNCAVVSYRPILQKATNATNGWAAGVSRCCRLLLLVAGFALISHGKALAAGPVISAQPEKAVVTAGSNHTFSVTASGTEPLEYRWYFSPLLTSGVTEAGAARELLLTSVDTNDAGGYHVVVSDVNGAVTSAVARLVVRLPDDPLYSAPQGGWSYLYNGAGVSNAGPNALDGTWNHDNGSDSWAGDGRGPGVGLLGGLSSTNGMLSVEDAVVSGTSSVDNRRYYFTHNLLRELSAGTADWILSNGVTLSFRARLTPPPPTDPLTELTNAPNGFVNVLDGKGMFGVRQAGANGLLISFSLNLGMEDTSSSATFDFGQAGLHMNNLNGDARSAQVDPGDGGTVNVLPLDPTVFHEFWITISDNGSAPGTHRVSIYMDGSKTATAFDVTAGSGSDAPYTNYLAMGLPSTGQRGAFDVDFMGYKPGVIAPSGLADPVEIVKQPASQMAAEGQSASFSVEVIGTAPFGYQWYRDGVAIADATNAVYTTAPATASDDGAQFVVAVSNLCGVVTSAPPAVLSFVTPPTIVSEPADLTVTNGSAASFSVEVLSSAAVSYQWRRNGVDLSGETNATLSIASAGPSHAGGYDVLAWNFAGSTTSRVAVLTVRVLDFGDAPAPYPTLLVASGAQHVIVSGVHLGAAVDYELDGAPDAMAQGDDAAGSDDEDGVTFTSPLRAGQLCTVEVVASTQGVLNAWIDFDRNGDWLGAGEQVFTDKVIAAGANQLTFTAPASASGGETFGRFRFGTAPGSASYGPEADGEVEDYRVVIVPVADVAVMMTDSPDPVAAGSNLVYTINVANLGPSPATGVTLTDALPTDTAFVSASSSAGACTHASGTVTCSLGGMASGSSAAVSIVVRPSAATLLTNGVTVSAAELDLQSANNNAVAVTEIEVAPAIATQPVSLVVTQNHTAIFSVTASGTEPLRYQWRFGGVDLAGQTGATLTISNAQPAHAGSYTVTVNNRVGGAQSEPATLTVLEPPMIAQQPASSTNTVGSTAVFSVTATGTAPLSYQWYYNEGAIGGATGAMLMLSNVQKSDAGDYKVVVANSAGNVTSAVARLTVIEADFGDAPDGPYPTLLASGGARHIAQPGVYLGSGVDFETDGQPSSGATGDDVNGTADEDGIMFRDALLVGQLARVDVIASTSGVLNAWFDFAGNGTWSDSGDQIFTNTPVVAGTNSLAFQVSAAATLQPTFARFRFSTASDLGFGGEAPDGEVEDYAVRATAAVQLAAAMTVSPVITAVGSNVSYEITVTNHGPSAAANVVVTDLLPGSVSFVSAVASGGACTQDGQLVRCELGTLAAAGSGTVVITATANVEGAITNVATAASSDHELFAGDNTAQVISEAQLYPAIVQQPTSQTVTNGDTATIGVVATGTNPQYQWSFKGTNISGATSATLVIAAVQPSHEGPYVVRVSNGVGSVTSAVAQLTVLLPPMITAQPQSIRVNGGSAASFTVQASGTEPLSYQWLHDGVPVSGGTGATLVITNAQRSDEGVYVVMVSNAAGAIQSEPATLSVVVAPEIVGHPQSATNFAGGTAMLSVMALGSEPLHYEWFFNDTNLVQSGASAVLMITNVQSANAGFYHAVVTNGAGMATSVVAQLSIVHADFGDAPEIGYPTLLNFNGAHHLIVTGVHFGSQIDFEGDGIPSATATGDDASNVADEDGVRFSAWRVGQTSVVEIVVSTNGFVGAWVDFNQNGTWSEPGEQVMSSLAVASGSNVVAFAVPATALSGQTFARFRFSTAAGLAVDGRAADGEVEDYAVMIAPAVDLGISVVSDVDPVVAEGALTYTITVTNGGPSDATAVIVNDMLPSTTTFVSAVASQGSCTNDGRLVSCNLGALPAGQTAVITITVTPLQAGMITNHASVSAAEVDVNGGNNDATEVTTVVEPTAVFGNASPIAIADGATADLYPSTIFVSGVTATVEKVIVTLNRLTHSLPADLDVLLVGPGGQRVLLMSDAGHGPGVADVTVTFDDAATLSLPETGFFVTETYRPTNFGEGDTFPGPAPPGPYARELSTFRGTNPNGTWSLYIVDDTVAESGFLAGGWAITFLTLERFADVSVTQRAAPSPVPIGSNLTYVITVTNEGFADVTGVRVSDVLPPSVTFVSVSSTLGACTNNGATADCVLGDMTNTQSATISVTVVPTMLGTITNEVSVTANELDFVTANNVSRGEVSVRVVNDLVLFASAAPEPVLMGQQLTYTLMASNAGPNPATDVMLRHDLPVTLAFAGADSSQGGCSNDGSVVYCALGTLSVGETVTITLFADPVQVSEVTARSTVSAYEIDLEPANSTALLATTIGDVPTFTMPLQDQTVLVLSNASFSVTTTGPAPITYQWLFNGTPLGGETSSTFRIASVRPSHAGTYSVVASNRFGVVVSAPARLVIDYTGYRRATTALVSNSDRWRYNHDGVDLGIGWREAGFNDTSWNEGLPLFGLEGEPNPYPEQIRTPLPLTTASEEFITTYYFRTRFNFQNSGVVLGLISSNLVDDGAAFYLNGTNVHYLRLLAPVSYSTLAESVVNEGEYDVFQWPADHLLEGTNVLAVEVHQSSPGSSDVIFGSTLWALTVPIADIAVSHTSAPSPVAVGSNLVLVTTVSNAGPDAAINIPVQQSWTGMANYSTASSTRGGCAYDGTNVNCTITSLAAGEVAQITVTIVPQQSGSLQSFVSARPAELDFELGNNSASASVVVRGPPVIASGPVSQTVTNGDSVLFSATITGTEPISLQWLHNGVEIPGATNAALSISNAQITEAGDYRLRATNDVGVAVADAVLRVLVRPTISAIADQVVDEDGTAGPVAFTIGDLETPLGELQLSASSSNPTLASETNIQFGGTGAERTITIVPPANRFGTAIISVIVRDGDGVSATETFELVVNSVNDAPTISGFSDSATPEDTPFAASITVADVETPAAALTVTVASSNPSLVPEANVVITGSDGTRNVTIMPLANQFGSSMITLTVADGEGGTTSASFVLSVDPVNDAPQISAIADRATSEDVPIAVDFSISDIETAPEALALTFASSNETLLPMANITVEGTGAARTLRLTPADQQSGSAVITLTVNDGGASNHTATLSFSLTVNAVNDAPTISDISAQEINEDNSTPAIAFSIGDVETPLDALILTASSSDPVLIPVANIVFSGSGSNRTVTITPATNAFGSAILSLTVTDGDGGTSTDSFIVTVLPVNDAPVLAPIADQVTDEDLPLTIGFDVRDEQTDALLLTFTSSNPGVIPTNNILITGTGTNRLLTLTPLSNAWGNATIEVVVTDAEGSSATDSFEFTVVSVNDAPTIDALTDLRLPEDAATQTVMLLGITSGASNEVQELRVTALSSDPALIPNPAVSYTSPDSSGTLQLQPNPGAFGSAVITVTVDDGQGSNNIVARTFTVIVDSINDLPSITEISDVATLEDVPTMTLAFAIGDFETSVENLTLTASSSDTNLFPVTNIVFSGTGTNRSVTLHPGAHQFGSATVSVTVADGDGGAAIDTFNVIVHSVNDWPTLDAISNLTTNEDAGIIRIPLTGIGSGAPNELQTLALTAVSSNPDLIQSLVVLYTNPAPAGVLQFVTATNASGVAEISITATENSPSNNVVTRTFSVTLNAVNDQPFISDIANQTTTEDTPTAPIAFTIGDVETAASNLVVTAMSSDPALLPDSNLALAGSGANRSLIITPAANQSGIAAVVVVVSDGQATAFESFVVTVSAVNDAPTISAIADVSAFEGTTVGPIPFTIGDAESLAEDVLTTLTSSNPGLIAVSNIVIGGTATQRTLTFRAEQSGTAVISISARDPQGASTTSSFTVTIMPVNDLPVISELADQTIAEDTTATVSFQVADEETTPAALTVTARSSNPALLPDSSLTLSGSQSNRTLRLAPLANQFGTATVTVTVTDTDGGMASDSFLLTVSSVNDMPAIVAASDYFTDEDTPIVIPVSVSDVETLADDLTITAVSSDSAVVPSSSINITGSGANRLLNIVPLPDIFGFADISLTVHDRDGGVTANSLRLTVVASNDAPTISAIADLSATEDSAVPPMQFTIGDVETAASNLTVVVSSSNSALLPAANILMSGSSSNRTMTLLPVANQHGSSEVTVIVYDADGGSATEQFIVSISPLNDLPSISALTDQTILQDTTLSVPVAVSDTETAPADLIVSVVSSNPSLVPAANITWGGVPENRILRITPATGATGAVTITVIVQDTASATASTSFGLNITARSAEAPVILTQPHSQVVSNGADVVFSVTAAGTAPLAYQWRFNGADIGGETGSILMLDNVQTSAAGTYTVFVSNAVGSTTSQPATLTVTDEPPPGDLNIADQTTSEDVPVVVPFSIGAAETLPFIVTAISANQSLVANSNLFVSGTGTNRNLLVTPNHDETGSVVITVAVSNEMVSLSDSFTLTVAPINDIPTLAPIVDVGVVQRAGQQTILLSGITPGAANEAQTLTVTVTNSNPSLFSPTITYTNGATTAFLRFTPPNNKSGTAVLTVAVNDGELSNNVVMRTFTVYVRTSAATPPTISNIADASIDEDTSTPAIAFTVGDSATPAANLIISAISSNPDLVPQSGIVFGGSGANRTIRVTPTPNGFGTAIITVCVKDTEFGLANDSFLLTVASVNDVPSLTAITNQTIDENSVLFPVGFVLSDADTPPSAITITPNSSNPSLIALSNITIHGLGTNRYVSARPTRSQSGASTITLTANDGAGGIASRSFTLTVTDRNDAPVISDIGNQFVRENSALTGVPFVVADSETLANDLTLSASSSNPSLVPATSITFGGSGANRTLNIQPATNQSGSAVITVTVHDRDGMTASDSFTFTVLPENDPPTLDPLADVQLRQGASAQTISLAGISSGAPGEDQQLAVSAVSSNPTLVPHPVVSYTSPGATGSLLLAPNPATNGAAVITVTVNDGEALVSRTFTVTVDARPVISAIADQVINEDSATAPIGFGVSDAETPAAHLVLTAASSNPALVPPSNVVISGVDSNRLVVVTPIANESGVTTITISVTDTNGNSASESFLLIVNAINDPPTLAALGNITLEEDAGPQSIPLSGITSGAPNENQELLVTVGSDNPGLFSALSVQYTSPSAVGALDFSLASGVSGVASVTVSVSDRQRDNSLVSRSFTLTVLARNSAPTISDIADATVVEDTQLGPISFAIGDSETPADNLLLSALSSNPAVIEATNVVFGGAGAARTLTLWPVPNAHGTSIVTVVVTDPRGETASDSFVIIVTPANDPPVISAIADRTVDEDVSTGAILFTIGDVETAASNLTVSLTSSTFELADRLVTFGGSGSNRSLTITPNPNRNGTAIMTVTVRDPQGGAARSSFVLTVNPTPDAPSISAVADHVMDEDGTLLVGIVVADWDETADRLTVTAASSNTGLVANASLSVIGNDSSRRLSIVPFPDQFGTAVIAVTVVDSTGRSATETFVLTVNPVNDPPMISAISDQNVSVNSSTAMLPFEIGDMETAASNLVVTAHSSNPSLISMSGSMISGVQSNRTVTVTPSADQFGFAVITLTVTDSEGATASSIFEVLVHQTSGPPVIALQPSSQDVIMGSDVILRVVATGPAPLNYQWHRNGVDLLGETNAALFFSHVPMEASAEYSVRVSNAEGSVLSSPARLRVFVRPVLRISRAGSTVTISFASTVGQSHVLEYKDSLLDATWTPIGSSVPGTGEDVTVSQSISGRTTRFYRVRAE